MRSNRITAQNVDNRSFNFTCGTSVKYQEKFNASRLLTKAPRTRAWRSILPRSSDSPRSSNVCSVWSKPPPQYNFEMTQTFSVARNMQFRYHHSIKSCAQAAQTSSLHSCDLRWTRDNFWVGKLRLIIFITSCENPLRISSRPVRMSSRQASKKN